MAAQGTLPPIAAHKTSVCFGEHGSMDRILDQYHNPWSTTLPDSGHWRLVGYRHEAVPSEFGLNY